MGRMLWIVGVLLALLIVSPAAGSTRPGKVVGVGFAELWWGQTRFAVHAVQAGAAAEATGWVRMCTPVGSSTVDVRCLRPAGDKVIVGGIIVTDTNPDAIGRGMVVVIEDGGPAVKDRIGVAFGPTAAGACPLDVLDAISRYDPLAAGNFTVLAHA